MYTAMRGYGYGLKVTAIVLFWFAEGCSPQSKKHNFSHRGTIVLTQRLEWRQHIYVF